MAKRKSANPFLGRWLIEEINQWDVGDESEELKPYIEFERSNTGQFQFGCVFGEVDCRLTLRDGLPAVEFTWDGRRDLLIPANLEFEFALRSSIRLIWKFIRTN